MRNPLNNHKHNKQHMIISTLYVLLAGEDTDTELTVLLELSLHFFLTENLNYTNYSWLHTQ